MDVESKRFWIGLGVAFVGIGFEVIHDIFPHWVGFAIIAAGIVVMFGPALASFSGPRLHLPIWLYAVPLKEAARRSYERVEGTDLEEAICGLNKPVEERLNWFEYSFIIQKLRMYGKRAPSRVARLIGGTDTARLHPGKADNELVSDFSSDATRYTDVSVNRRDLRRYWRKHLKPLSKAKL